MMTFLSSLITENEIVDDPSKSRVGEQCEATAEDSGVVNSKKRKLEKEGVMILLGQEVH
jgi:hypothetical protein